jgi:hypothetical protein
VNVDLAQVSHDGNAMANRKGAVYHMDIPRYWMKNQGVRSCDAVEGFEVDNGEIPTLKANGEEDDQAQRYFEIGTNTCRSISEELAVRMQGISVGKVIDLIYHVHVHDRDQALLVLGNHRGRVTNTVQDEDFVVVERNIQQKNASSTGR